MELRHTAERCGRLSSFLREEMAMSLGLMNRLKWQEKIFGDKGTVLLSHPAHIEPSPVLRI